MARESKRPAGTRRPNRNPNAATPLVASLLAAHEILDRAGIRHALLGGIAANFYRKDPRATRDVDFGVLATPAEVVAVVEAFRSAGWEPEIRAKKAEVLRLARLDTPRIDLLVAGTPFEEAAIARAAKIVVERVGLLVVRPEDLIVYKLIAGRAQDYEAVASILNTLDEIDAEYVEGWLEQFDVQARWKIARREAALIADE